MSVSNSSSHSAIIYKAFFGCVHTASNDSRENASTRSIGNDKKKRLICFSVQSRSFPSADIVIKKNITNWALLGFFLRVSLTLFFLYTEIEKDSVLDIYVGCYLPADLLSASQVACHLLYNPKLESICYTEAIRSTVWYEQNINTYMTRTARSTDQGFAQWRHMHEERRASQVHAEKFWEDPTTWHRRRRHQREFSSMSIEKAREDLNSSSVRFKPRCRTNNDAASHAYINRWPCNAIDREICRSDRKYVLATPAWTVNSLNRFMARFARFRF